VSGTVKSAATAKKATGLAVTTMGSDLSLDGKPMRAETLLKLQERLWPRFVEVPCHVPGLDKPCKIWQGAKTGGHGTIEIREDGKRLSFYVHRATYCLERGPIPAGLDIDHLCRQRACGETSHMEPVTRGENVRRGLSHSPEVRMRAGKAISAAQTGKPRPHSEAWSEAVRKAWTPEMRAAAAARARKRAAK